MKASDTEKVRIMLVTQSKAKFLSGSDGCTLDSQEPYHTSERPT
jgi:hypothetical protein